MMDLQKLFEIQAGLDAHIVEEKGLESQNLLDEKFLALKVELGELANEQRTWKFWSEDREPRNKEIECHACKGIGEFEYLGSYPEKCNYCDGTGIQERSPLLLEYVDCLHFILSIGNNIRCNTIKRIKLIHIGVDITAQFNSLFKLIGNWEKELLFLDKTPYHAVVNEFLLLGEMLGFTEEQIEQAYLDKNKINHERQLNGY